MADRRVVKDEAASIAAEELRTDLEHAQNLLSDLCTLHKACNRMSRSRGEGRGREELQLQVKLLQDELQQERKAREELLAEYDQLRDLLKKTFGQLVDDLLSAKQALHSKERQVKDLMRNRGAAHSDEDVEHIPGNHVFGDQHSWDRSDQPPLRLLKIQQQIRAMSTAAARSHQEERHVDPGASTNGQSGIQARQPLAREDGAMGQRPRWQPQYWRAQEAGNLHTSSVTSQASLPAPWPHAELGSALLGLVGSSAEHVSGQAQPQRPRQALFQDQSSSAGEFSASSEPPSLHEQGAVPPARSMPSRRTADKTVPEVCGAADSCASNVSASASLQVPTDHLPDTPATRQGWMQAGAGASPSENSSSAASARSHSRMGYGAGPSSSCSDGSPRYPESASGPSRRPGLRCGISEDHGTNSPFTLDPFDAAVVPGSVQHHAAAATAAVVSSNDRVFRTWTSSAAGGYMADDLGETDAECDEEQDDGWTGSATVAAVSGQMASFLRSAQSAAGASTTAVKPAPSWQSVSQGGQPHVTTSQASVLDEPSSESLFRAIKGQLENLQAVFNIDVESLSAGDAQPPAGTQQQQPQNIMHSRSTGGGVERQHRMAVPTSLAADLNSAASSNLIWPEETHSPAPGMTGDHILETAVTSNVARKQERKRDCQAHTSMPQGFMVVGRGV